MEKKTVEMTKRQWYLLIDCIKWELHRERQKREHDQRYIGELQELGAEIATQINKPD